MSQILQAKLHLGRLISSEKIKGTAMVYAGKWFILVCAYSCLNENARARPGEKERHLNTSTPLACAGKVSSVLRAKVPLPLEKGPI